MFEHRERFLDQLLEIEGQLVAAVVDRENMGDELEDEIWLLRRTLEMILVEIQELIGEFTHGP